jgi:UDP-N-acetylmuramate dehydrogenase
LKIQQNISLKAFNTFHVDVNAARFITINSRDDLIKYVKGRNDDHDPFVLGGGSNVLFTGDLERDVLKIEIKGSEKTDEDEHHVWVKAGAGEDWDDLVAWCVENEWWGIENLSDIPGSVGAAPIQNIGAYGVELKDVFVKLEAIDLSTGASVILNKEQCRFGYRDSIFKHEYRHKYVIVSVTLKLSKEEHRNVMYMDFIRQFHERRNRLTIGEIREAVCGFRKTKLPNLEEYGCAGSFFKNPVVNDRQWRRLQNVYSDIHGHEEPGNRFKLSAGQLLDAIKLKGYREGAVGIYEKHALIIVNHGEATGKEIYEFAKYIRDKATFYYGIQFEFEVNIIT